MTSILSSVLEVLTSLFFIVTLLAFLAFDSAKTERLAEGARRHRPYLVDAMARSREAREATSGCRRSSA